MSDQHTPDPAAQPMPEADQHPGHVEETSEEHAHVADEAIPADRVEETRVHQENSPREQVGNEGA